MKRLASLLIAAASLAFGSCNLDVFPKDRLEQTQALQSLDDLYNFEVGAYARFKNMFQLFNIIGGDIQADYVNAVTGFSNNYGSLHRWSFTAADYDTTDTWDYAYFAIAQCCFIIDNAPNIQFEDASEAAEGNYIIGEAYLMRAIANHMLALKFCDSYTKGNTTNPHTGLPKVDSYEPTAMPERETLEETYARILEDIREAKSRMAGETGYPNAEWLTEDCVTALEAQVYLAMGNYSAALTAANTLINSGNYALVDSAEELVDMWTYDVGDEIIFVFGASQTSLPPQFGYYFNYDRNSKDDAFEPDYIPTQATVDMFDDADYRKEAYFYQTSGGDLQIGGKKISTPAYLINKYPGNPDLRTSAAKNYRNAFKLFRLAEMYLIAAEAAAQTGGDAATPLNELRAHRGLPALGSVTLADVKEERFRELMFEGNRIADLRRWGDPVVRGAAQQGKNEEGEDYALASPGEFFDQLNLPASDYRLVWPIPETAIYANQNLKGQQNPGWER